MNKYDLELSLEENSSTGKIIHQIEKGSTVLEFGCANGRMTKYMSKQLECSVYIVEIDEEAYGDAQKYAADGLCDNLENYRWLDKFGNVRFDTVIFADVLEHLRDPLEVLKKTKLLLKEDGKVIISVPNIGHSDILVNLYNNNFEYMPLGLLDDTHIRFFAYRNLEVFCNNAGYDVVIEDATVLPPFFTEQSKQIDEGKKAFFSKLLYGKELYDVYQFIYTLQMREYVTKTGKAKVKKIKHNYYGIDSSLIFDFGEGFDLNSYREIVPYKTYEDRYYFEFEIPDNAVNVVFHPIQQKACVVSDIIAIADMIGSIKPIVTKGLELDGMIIYPHKDPCIVFECGQIRKIQVSMVIVPIERESEILNVSLIADNIGRFKAVEEAGNESKIKEEELVAKEEELASKEEELASKEEELASKEEELATKEELVVKNEKLRAKDYELNTIQKYLEKRISERNHVLTEKDNIIYQKNCTIDELNRRLEQYNRGYYNHYSANRRYINCGKIEENRSCFYKEINRSDGEYFIKGNKSNKGYTPQYRQSLYNEAESIDAIECIDRMDKKIAVHLHLYYVDLLPEFFNYLNNIPFVFDLYVSCPETSNLEFIGDAFGKLRYVNDIIVRVTENRGRDIAPLYVLFNKEIQQHDYFLHIHSKKSLYRGSEQKNWRQKLLESTIGSEALIRKIFMIFEGNRKVGLLFPETVDMHLIAHSWLQNQALGMKFLRELGIENDEELFNYPVGSFFWARTHAVLPLFEKEMKYEDFSTEEGQTDGTLAHVLERVISFTARHRGYELAIVDSTDRIVRFGRSLKLYEPIFAQTERSMLEFLSKFEVITFDIFDTLITRKIYEPDDLFKVMDEKIYREMGIISDFKKIRKEAEAHVWEKHHYLTTIDEIYDELQTMLEISDAEIQKIKEMEISLEILFALPRKSVVKVYKELVRRGKKIILLSDMYLTRDIIEKILHKCGIEGYYDMWVSCEKNCRKDDGSMWKKFFAEYGKFRCVHVGDNMVSDVQLPTDCRKDKDTYYIINPRTAFKLSKAYSTLFRYITNRDAVSSLVLGMIVNQTIYNSPFCLGQYAEPVIVEDKDVGYAVAGPLFACFIKQLVDGYQEKEKLLFLSREGYVLKKLFEKYCSNKKIRMDARPIYFLASRRAVSVAAIKSDEDMREILLQDYQGSVGTLLYERLGVDISQPGLSKCQIHMPEDIDIIDTIIPYISEEVRAISGEERKTYLTYINNVVSETDHLCVVDLGYSGTIQYYLAKLLDKKVAGKYLCTGPDIKPKKLMCKVESMFEADKKTRIPHRLQYDSGFLEAMLEAPYGQLVRFETDGKGVKPIYKEGGDVREAVVGIQKGILDFVDEFSQLDNELKIFWDLNPEFAVDILLFYAKAGVLASNITDDLKVEDGYCQNGTIKFSNRIEGRVEQLN